MVQRITIILALFLSLNKAVTAQDAEFSQFYANPLYLNPALAGADICKRAITNYRNQWPNMTAKYISYNASYDQFVPKLHGGIGVLMNLDDAGDGILRTFQASLMYAYTLRVSNDMFINMSMQGTLYQKYLNWNLLRFGDQIDPLIGFTLPTQDKPPDYNSIIFPDFDAGLVFGWKGVLHGGVAVHHLTQPNMAYYVNNDNRLPMKLTGHFGVNINPNGEGMYFDPIFWIAPNILYMQQGEFHQFNTGLYVIRLPLVLGTWYRFNFENSDAVIALVGLQYDHWKIGYSYDMTLSKLRNDTGGAHEISLTYTWDCIPSLREVFPYAAPGF
jgi:type IX secretion system PorP/SprF family membrane protein